MDIYTDTDTDTDVAKGRDRDNVYGLGQKNSIQIKKTGTNCGSKDLNVVFTSNLIRDFFRNRSCKSIDGH
jgi:hypothetical protein